MGINLSLWRARIGVFNLCSGCVASSDVSPSAVGNRQLIFNYTIPGLIFILVAYWALTYPLVVLSTCFFLLFFCHNGQLPYDVCNCQSVLS
jgi:hypothetical protein